MGVEYELKFAATADQQAAIREKLVVQPSPNSWLSPKQLRLSKISSLFLWL